MVIFGQSKILPAHAFMEGLTKVMHGLLRVEVASSSSSAWLLTDSLVIVPDYVGVMATTFVCHPYGEEAIEAALVLSLSAEAKGSQPAILRLPRPLPGRALKLEAALSKISDLVCLLQYPEGNPDIHFSIGNITNVSPGDIWLDYDADTLPGSGGAPVINLKNWTVIGMHTTAMRDSQLNRGLRIDPILDALRKTDVWSEIVQHHRLAETAYTLLEDLTTPTHDSFKLNNLSPNQSDLVSDPALQQAAVSWSINPNKIELEFRKKLKPFIEDEDDSEWTLKLTDRQRFLASIGSLERIKQLSPHPSSDGEGQAVIHRILAGPPYHLEDVGEDELLYWLQAVRWFEDLVPGLPTPADINMYLHRKRTRSRLSKIIEGFRGRTTELSNIYQWFDNDEAGPLLITGIGGVGKSALVGYFVHHQPADSLLLWLDFDRPDLAADDAVSVLKVIAQQGTFQLINFTAPEIKGESWRDDARELGRRIAQTTMNAPEPLLVLDGFEVAQHAKEYHEIWEVLELVMTEVVRLKVIVSGRAPVKSLKLKEKKATLLPLKGLTSFDAEQWLRERGIHQEPVLSQVLALAEGIPLRLKLAVRLIEAGEEIESLPEKLPKEYIAGYLYKRILQRVIDASLIPIVKGLLVLRKCSREMMADLFAGRFPPSLAADQVYDRLSREMALVGDAENLYGSFVIAGNKPNYLELRPEVRAATLHLLEMDNPNEVKIIDQKAVDWYARQGNADAEYVAEKIYHLLRLGRLPEAIREWRPAFEPFLRDAWDDLPLNATVERTWLKGKVEIEDDEQMDDLIAWENKTFNEIRSRFRRGITRDLYVMLSTRKQRSHASPLLIYDAWELWKKGDLNRAIHTLVNAEEAAGAIQRDRNIIQAFFCAASHRFPEADRLLEAVELNNEWNDHKDATVFETAVRASRVRFTVDIDSELALYKNLKSDPYHTVETLIKKFLTSSDVVTPLLCNQLSNPDVLESFSGGLDMPMNENQASYFWTQLEEERKGPASFALSIRDNGTTEGTDNWKQQFFRLVEPLSSFGTIPQAVNSAFDLALKGRSRWRLARQKVIPDFVKIASSLSTLNDPLLLSVIGTLAVYRGQKIRIKINESFFESIDELISRFLRMNLSLVIPPPLPKRVSTLRNYFDLDDQEFHQSQYGPNLGFGQMFDNPEESLVQMASLLRSIQSPEITSIVLYLYGPDPLEMLCRRILGLPDHSKLYNDASVA